MQTYSSHQPTGFDRRGAFLPDRQFWLVLPVSRTRDSGCLDESNFATAVKLLGGESEVIEVHRFGHWGPGWYEIILVDPSDAAAVRMAQEIESRLSDYPVLDEEDFSRREWDLASETWAQLSVRERIEILQEHGGSIFQARRDELPQDDNGSIFECLARP